MGPGLVVVVVDKSNIKPTPKWAKEQVMSTAIRAEGRYHGGASSTDYSKAQLNLSNPFRGDLDCAIYYCQLKTGG
jgi:hypothetical protein